MDYTNRGQIGSIHVTVIEAGTYHAVFLVDLVHIHQVIFIQVGSCRGVGFSISKLLTTA